MELDYRAFMNVITIRQKQISNLALERDYFNTEHQALEEIRQQLGILLKNERKSNMKFFEVPCVGEVQTVEPK